VELKESQLIVPETSTLRRIPASSSDLPPTFMAASGVLLAEQGMANLMA
jgi:hypothetical protein